MNPAVTVALAALGKFEWKKVGHYMLAQYLGAFFASGLVFLTYHEGIEAFDNGLRSAYGNATSTGGIFATYPGQFVSIGGAFIDQASVMFERSSL